MTLYLYKTTEWNESIYLKNPIKISAILNIENDDKRCFLWSILAHRHPVVLIILIECQFIHNTSIN